MPDDQVGIAFEGAVSAAQRKAVVGVLRDAGFTAEVPTDARRGAAETAAAVVVVAPLAKFFQTLAEEAGKEAAGGARGLVRRLAAALGDDARVRLEDRGTGPIVHLAAALPDDAYRALESLDWSVLGDGDVSWDGRGWRLVD